METAASSSAHTPGPWFLDGPYRIPIDDDLLVAGMMIMLGDPGSPESFPIARVTGPAYLGREDECDEQLLANARRIVTACNAFDDLLGACNQALGFVEAWEKNERVTEPTDTHLRLEAAITKATGEAA